MSTLVILQCTGKKALGGQPMSVPDPFSGLLGSMRHQLMELYQPNLNFDELMPAYQRYGAGQLYSNMDWHTALQKIAQGSLKIIIVSALFGALEYDTPIPAYDLVMSKTKRRWLGGNLLGNTIQTYILANPNIKQVKSFISPSDYLPAMGNFIPPGIDDLGDHWIPYSRGAEVAIGHVTPFINRL